MRPATETAHVLMTDRVGYSLVPLEEKAILDQELLEAVQTCPAVQGLGEDKCLRLDSGDGISLVFFGDPIAAVEAALHLYEKVAANAKVKLRIGIHSGLVTRRQDANAKTNVSGPGIEKAQRAMAAGDGDQILMTEFFAENLRAFEAWRDRLIDLGDHTIKHGEKLHLYGLSNLPKPAQIPKPAPKQGAGQKGKVAVVYRRKAQPDDSVLEMLEGRLPEYGFNVFIDRHLTIGVQWAQKIEQEIRTADAVIVLLSDRAAASEMVLFELQTAIDQRHQGGTPAILPVRIGAEDPAEGDIGALLKPFHYAVWMSDKDNDALVEAVVKALTQPEPEQASLPLERVGGAMPPESPYYVSRPTDKEFVEALLSKDSIVLVKGGRQIGKTSLMARSLREATKAGSKVVWTDLQSFAKAQLETDEQLYLALASEFMLQLDLDDDPIDSWRSVLGANTNFERYLKTKVFKQVHEPIIWAIDEVDRLFAMPYSGDFFGMIRSWHNRRATTAEDAWTRFTVALAYATEAHLFISDLNQSPFNVGTRLELADFNAVQLADLNAKYGSPLKSDDELRRFHSLVGGQPFLTRRGLDEMVRYGVSLADLEMLGPNDEGPFGDHLRRLLVALSNDSTMLQEVGRMIAGAGLEKEESFFRLRSGGLLRGASKSSAEFRCGLYKEYLSQHL